MNRHVSHREDGGGHERPKPFPRIRHSFVGSAAQVAPLLPSWRHSIARTSIVFLFLKGKSDERYKNTKPLMYSKGFCKAHKHVEPFYQSNVPPV